jgi:hypothetical protein
MPRMNPRSCALVAALTASLALIPAGAASARSCGIHNQERSFGPTYVTLVSESGTSCRRAKAVVRAFHACRKAHGGIKRGRCPAKASVLGYRCTEKRGSIPTQSSGKVTCRNGKARVIHTYTQFT